MSLSPEVSRGILVKDYWLTETHCDGVEAFVYKYLPGPRANAASLSIVMMRHRMPLSYRGLIPAV